MCNRDTWYGEGTHVLFLPDLPICYTVNAPNTWNQDRADPYEFTKREEYAVQMSVLGLGPHEAGNEQYARYIDELFTQAGHKVAKREAVAASSGPITFLEG